ncbi:MAG: permease-like cell division protein FtsX [Gammaproteobacteria bacterium]|nr:permease-like cell division protein FtsX [Gammaproteobacteria bacterium]
MKRHHRRRGATPISSNPKQKTDETNQNTRQKSVNQKGVQRHNSLALYFQQHHQAIKYALQRVFHSKSASIMTILVIGIALSLPLGLHVLIKNTLMLSKGVEDRPSITLFLMETKTNTWVKRLENRLVKREDIDSVKVIDPEQALAEFQDYSDLNPDFLKLPHNPLPYVIEVYPKLDQQDFSNMEKLQAEFQGWPEVHLAQLDMLWLQRLYAIVSILKSSSNLISALLAMGVLLIIGNTIRLMSQAYSEEIRISKLVGATNAYVSRPFIYSGLMYGFLGGICAIVIIGFAVILINPSVQRLLSLYNNERSLIGLNMSEISIVLAIGMSLGLFGAWVTARNIITKFSL